MKVLAPMAGMSTRLLPDTQQVHKALLAIGERPLLHWQLDAFDEAGFDEIVIVSGHGAGRLESSIAGHPAHSAVTLVHNERYADRNLDYSVLCCRGLCDGRAFVYHEGDTWLAPSVLRRLTKASAACALVVSRDRASIHPDTLVFGHLDHVQRVLFVEHGDVARQWRNPDLLGEFVPVIKLSAQVSTRLFQRLAQCTWTGPMRFYAILNELLQEARFEAIEAVAEEWVEIDNHGDWVRADRIVPRNGDIARLDARAEQEGG